ncbi:MAG TPA: hypothetical protein V6D00_03210 [Pantanalinema sp.]
MFRANLALITFLGPLLLPVASPAAPRAEHPASAKLKVGAFGYDEATAVITLPVEGAIARGPMYLEPRSRVAFMELPAGRGVAEFLRRTQSLNPSKGIAERILVANNRPGVVRIAVRGRVPIRFYPELVRQDDHHWLLRLHLLPFEEKAPARKVPVAPAPAAPPVSTPRPLPSPAPSAAPASPPPEPEPPLAPGPPSSPEASPPPAAMAPVPLATPTPAPRVPEGPEPQSRLEVARRWSTLSEDYAAGSSNNVRVEGASAWEAGWTHRWTDAWSTRAALSAWEPYTIVDLDLKGSTHTRSTVGLDLEAAWHTDVLGAPVALGAGWWLSHESVTHTVQPLAPLFLFSSRQLYTGPSLSATTALKVFGPLRVYVAAQARPIVFSALDADVDPIGPLLGARGEAGVDLAWGMAALRVGYRAETLRSPDMSSFGQDVSGPLVALGWRY